MTTLSNLDLDPALRSDEAARRIHRALLRELRANEEGVRLDFDPEFLHDYRVAVRRTRSALTQIRHVFPEHGLDEFRKGFRWLGRVTGPVRDLDVHLAKFVDYVEGFPKRVRKELRAVEMLLLEEKRSEHGTLTDVLRSDRYHHLLRDWQSFLDEPLPERPSPRNALRPVLHLASEAIGRSFQGVAQRGLVLTSASSTQDVHDLRIACKKLRYLLDFFHGLYTQHEVKPLIADLKRMQDHLGDFNDCVVQRKMLRALAHRVHERREASADALLAMGRVTERLKKRQARERKRTAERVRRFLTDEACSRFERLFGRAAQESPEEGDSSL